MSVRAPSPPLNYDYSVITPDTDQSATLLLDAKNEYHKQLTSHLRQPIFNLMKTIYSTAENICHQENTPENILMVFQDNLAQVPKWSKPRRTKEYEAFLKLSKCDWFNELIKFTYVTHVKILTIVNKPRPNVKLSITIPSGGTFYHGVCINVARELWRSPFLFSKHVGKYEYQKNMRQIEQLIDNSVDICIRTHIPMKTILQEYLDSDLAVPDTLTKTSAGTQPVTSPPKESIAEHMTQSPPSVTSTSASPVKQVDDKEDIPSTARSSKLTINNNANNLDEFIDTSESESSPISTSINKTTTTDTTTNTSTNGATNTTLVDNTNNTNNKAVDDDLESVSFNSTDEVVDELDIIETAIEDKESVISKDEAYKNLAVVSLDTNTNSRTNTPTASLGPISITSTTTNTDDNQTVPTNGLQIEEFDIDSLPEISLSQIITNNPVDKPSSPAPTQLPTSQNTTEIPPEKTQSRPELPNNISKNKDIPLTDMNEPGIFPELKQPTPTKKQLVIEDLPTEDLDEVNLGAHAEELRTTKRISLPGTTQSSNSTSRQKNFAFF
jgi:hypothetical protein